MSNIFSSFFKGWKLVFTLYVLVLLCSHSAVRYFDLNSHNTDILITEYGDSSDEAILLIPTLQKKSYLEGLIDSLSISKKVFYIDYQNYFDELAEENKYAAFEKAKRIAVFIKEKGFPSLDVVAHGFGSIITADLITDQDLPFRTATLINPEGIIEYELLSGYHLNQAVYAAKGMGYWLMDNLVPHFGLYDVSHLNRYYRARIDTDLRNIRGKISAINIPVLITDQPNLEGYNEGSVKEWQRLIPHSKLIEYDRTEEDLFASLVIDEIEELVGTKKDHSVSVSREIKSLLPFSNEHVVQVTGYALYALMILIIFSTFVSEDLTCIGAGLLAAKGVMGYWPAMIASLLGIFIGDILLYLGGRWLGDNAVNKAPFKWFITEKDLQKSYRWFEAKGPMIIIASRFIPGTRFATYVSAGIIGANFWVFIVYFGIASILWTPVLVGLAMIIGQELMEYFYIYQEYAVWVLIGIISAIFISLKVILPLTTFRGRRLLSAKLKRTIQWEFWPSYVIYFPVLIYAFILAIKYRSLTVFTTANPSIEDGGFIGESKSGILSGIKKQNSLARFELLESYLSHSELLSKAKDFINRYELNYPVVLKPDVGERGKGVNILKSESELVDALSVLEKDYIIQEYIPGKEFGVFYFRYPDQEKGEIFSITRKELLTIKADGIHSLEELILRDEQAVYLANTHFDKHYDKLYDIPEEGKVIKLVELGTHALGARFYDANDLITEELSEEIDGISKSFKDFFFGRFDLKVPSAEELKRGEHIKIIELNGVTSESTNIYDPEHSYLFAVKTLMRQWKIAFEIGAQNHASGKQASTFSHLLSKLSR